MSEEQRLAEDGQRKSLHQGFQLEAFLFAGSPLGEEVDHVELTSLNSAFKSRGSPGLSALRMRI
ncbi:hypothetical protein IV102_31130 [bacterium]|nr:hypothetical protein [bacterium]